jgi:hypothetical protein
MKAYILPLIYVALLSCLTTSQRGEIVIQSNSDTLMPDFDILNLECQEVSNGFFRKYGFTVSNFFEVVTEEIFDVNNDGIKDSIAILSPKNLLLPSLYPFCQNEGKGNRILLVRFKDFRASYKTLIRNETGIATLGIEQIEKADSGFNLTYQKGQSCFFSYKISISFYDRNLFIDSIKASAGCPGEKVRDTLLKYSKSEFLLENFNRTKIDSIEEHLSSAPNT